MNWVGAHFDAIITTFTCIGAFVSVFFAVCIVKELFLILFALFILFARGIE